MKTKAIHARRSLLVVSFIVFGAAAAFCEPQQASSTSPGHGGATNQQLSIGASVVAAAAPVIAQVEVTREGQKAFVQVKGNNPLANRRTMRLSNPDRVVLDFAGAHLAIPHSSIPAAFPPIRGVRAGQFRPDVARVVIDLEREVPYHVQTLENSITVEFDVAASVASASTAPFLSPAVPIMPVVHAQPLPSTRSAGANVPARRAVADMNSTPRSDSSMQRPAALAGRLPPKNEGAPLANGLASEVLTFREQNQTLQSVLKQIGDQTGVSIYLAEGLGKEQLSVQFRHFRLDEALRQMLTDYDVHFIYGPEQNGQRTALREVWIYPAVPAQTMQPLKEVASTTAKEAALPQSDSNPVLHAEASNGPKGSDSVVEVLKALENPNDNVREQALSRALITKAQIPQEMLVNMALADVSAKVRLQALQALPLDPNLRWVAERATGDWDQSVSQAARGMLRSLDERDSAESWAAHTQEPPHQ
jgi:hypothetical protein